MPELAGRSLTFLLGGARSGKSAYAEKLATALQSPWTYIATAQAFDDEMRERIALHRARRPKGWITRDASLGLAAAIHVEPGSPVLVDCLTLWLSNVMLARHDMPAAMADLEEACAIAAGPLVLVSNEVGLGIVSDNELARRFRDHAGLLHQRLAARADRVILMVAGLPLTVK